MSGFVHGARLWWRGLDRAWQSRWAVLVPMGLLLVVAGPQVVSCFVDCGVWWELFPAPGALGHLPGRSGTEASGSAREVAWEAINGVRWPFAPDEAGSLLVLCAFAAACWHGVSKSAPGHRRPLVTGGLVAVFALGLWCVLKWVPMFPSGFFEWAPLGRTVGTAYDIVARATTTGLVGSVFWCAVQRRRPSIGRVVRRTACCLWPLLVFYFLLYAPGHVFWRWLSWTVFTLQVRVLHRAILPTFVWVVPARVLWAWIRVAPVAGLPFPLLALSTKGNARRTLRDLIQLYRRCWRQLTVLLLLTACMFVGLSVAGEAISNPIRSRPSLTYAVSWYVVAVKVLASIAGVMGMFLVIEEWRKSERPTVAGERR